MSYLIVLAGCCHLKSCGENLTLDILVSLSFIYKDLVMETDVASLSSFWDKPAAIAALCAPMHISSESYDT